jgi:hypothetical protein
MSFRRLPAPAQAGVAGIHVTTCSGACCRLDIGDKPRYDKQDEASERPRLPGALSAFEFAGFDLLEADGTTSALTNCGGFPLAFDNSELSSKGLIESYERAAAVHRALLATYPQEPHAACDLWAVFVVHE